MRGSGAWVVAIPRVVKSDVAKSNAKIGAGAIRVKKLVLLQRMLFILLDSILPTLLSSMLLTLFVSLFNLKIPIDLGNA